MQKWRVCIVLSALLFLFSTIVPAISIGPIRVKSHQGERFQAEIPVDLLREEAPENLSVAIGSTQDYQLLQGQKSDVLTNLKTTIVPTNDGAKVLIQSNKPINQQTFDLVVRTTLDQGTILKKYLISLPAQRAVSRSLDIQKDAMPLKKPSTAMTSSNMYGPVNPGETLIHVARKLATPDRDVETVAIALWRTNRQAFVGGNLHGLRFNTLLKLQDLDKELASLNPAESHQTILSQWEEWNSVKSKIAKGSDLAKKNETSKKIATDQTNASPDKLNPANAKATIQPAATVAQSEQTKQQIDKEGTEAKGAASSTNKREQSSSSKRGLNKANAVVAGTISDSPATKTSNKGKSDQATQVTLATVKNEPVTPAPVKSEQVSPGPESTQPATLVGSVGENFEKTIASLKDQVAKIKKELQMFKERLFEMEGQNQSLRQYLTYLFYFTAGENILIIGLVVFFYIRKRKTSGKEAEAVDNGTIWVKK